MSIRLQTYTHTVSDAAGRAYRVHAEGEREPGGNWIGWLAFEPVGTGVTLRTDRETSQGKREDLEYWATGLEPVYFEGAFARARPVTG